jgi:hypothetical protein
MFLAKTYHHRLKMKQNCPSKFEGAPHISIDQNCLDVLIENYHANVEVHCLFGLTNLHKQLFVMGTKPINTKRFLRHTKPRPIMEKTSLNLITNTNHENQGHGLNICKTKIQKK